MVENLPIWHLEMACYHLKKIRLKIHGNHVSTAFWETGKHFVNLINLVYQNPLQCSKCGSSHNVVYGGRINLCHLASSAPRITNPSMGSLGVYISIW